MKKMYLIGMLTFCPGLAINKTDGVEKITYQGTTLQEFQKQDPELKSALNKSAWDYTWSWLISPSAQRVEEIKETVALLRKKLPIIQNTLEEAVAKVPKKSTSDRITTNDVLYFVTSIVYLPWMMVNSMFRTDPRAQAERAVRQIQNAYAQVQKRIDTLEWVVKNPSLCSTMRKVFNAR